MKKIASHIIVVDDDPQLRGFIRVCLERGGYRVTCASDGINAMEVIERGGADLVLTDIFMPGGDGLEVLMTLRKRFPDLPAVAMSGGANRMDHDFLPAATAMGARAVLAKPFTREELLEQIALALSATPPAMGAKVG